MNLNLKYIGKTNTDILYFRSKDGHFLLHRFPNQIMFPVYNECILFTDIQVEQVTHFDKDLSPYLFFEIKGHGVYKSLGLGTNLYGHSDIISELALVT